MNQGEGNWIEILWSNPQVFCYNNWVDKGGRKMEDKGLKDRVLKAYNIGMKRYILVHGVINWGVSTALIYRMMMIIKNEGLSLGKIIRGIFTVQTFYALILFGMGGLLFGLFMWKWIEREVLKYKQKGKKKK